MGKVDTLTQTVGELCAEIARLKGPPDIKSRGMDKATEPAKLDRAEKRP